MAGATIRQWEALPGALAGWLEDAFGCRIALEGGDHPALGWRRSGLMAVSGLADGPGLVAPAPLTSFADAALSGLRRLSGSSALPANGALLLGERARLMGLARRGAVSANGSCRLLPVADGHVALNLPRDDDWDLVTALVQEPVEDWEGLAALVRSWRRDALVERGRLLGLAIASDREPPIVAAPCRVERLGSGRRSAGRSPLVVDLSSLWAGPLAGALLAGAGARVVKVESRGRPDGARGGDPRFFALINGGKESRLFDFRDEEGLRRLRALVGEADIVIEASRPRALAQLGIDARAETRRGATWLSITAHGRDGEMGDAIGFGDDAAVAGGLTARMRQAWGATIFAGDAIADPLTGILAALAGWASWTSGGGRLVSLAMADVVAFACGFGLDDPEGWQALAMADDAPLYPMRSV